MPQFVMKVNYTNDEDDRIYICVQVAEYLSKGKGEVKNIIDVNKKTIGYCYSTDHFVGVPNSNTDSELNVWGDVAIEKLCDEWGIEKNSNGIPIIPKDYKNLFTQAELKRKRH